MRKFTRRERDPSFTPRIISTRVLRKESLGRMHDGSGIKRCNFADVCQIIFSSLHILFVHITTLHSFFLSRCHIFVVFFIVLDMFN